LRVCDFVNMEAICFAADAWKAEGLVCGGCSEESGWIDFVLNWVVEEDLFCLFVFFGAGELSENLFAKSCDLLF